MIRDDTVMELAQAAVERNPVRTRQLLERIAEQQEQGSRNGRLGPRIRHLLSRYGGLEPGNLRGSKLIETLTTEQSLSDLILEENTKQEIEDLIEENVRQPELEQADLEPRHSLLLIGPPGNGKTSVARGIANRLERPLHRVTYGKTISSLLGESIAHIDQIFEVAESHPCVLLMDEMETIGAERGAGHDTGEMRRVTAGLLIRMEETPWSTLVIGATNHPELLDRAAWRRFEVRLELTAPNGDEATRYLAGTLGTRIKSNERERWDAALAGLSYGELEQLARRLLRRRVLTTKETRGTDLEEITEGRRRIAGPKAGRTA